MDEQSNFRNIYMPIVLLFFIQLLLQKDLVVYQMGIYFTADIAVISIPPSVNSPQLYWDIYSPR